MEKPRIIRRGGLHVGSFTAMAGPCEIMLETRDGLLARELVLAAWRETCRIEAKFSRYRDDSVTQRINRAGGATVTVDAETADLLDFAATCHAASNGRFDITAGVFRRVWSFDGGTRVPSRKAVKQLLDRVGWRHVRWQRPRLTLPAGMEIDLGGLGKEYAVDRVLTLLRSRAGLPVLVNFGGDLHASGPRRDGSPWYVGVEDPGHEDRPRLSIALAGGALATSGDARRYVMHRGRRLGHVLNPRTGWPPRDAPRSVTVLADTCTEAGILATVALLHGREAEHFLREQGCRHWVLRG